MRIAELEARTGLTRHTIRFYEKHGVLSPPRRSENGYRDYDDDVVAELDLLRRTRSVGFTLAEIATILAHLRDRTLDCVRGAELAEARLLEVEARLVELRAVRSALQDARRELVDSAIAHELDVPAALLPHRTPG